MNNFVTLYFILFINIFSVHSTFNTSIDFIEKLQYIDSTNRKDIHTEGYQETKGLYEFKKFYLSDQPDIKVSSLKATPINLNLQSQDKSQIDQIFDKYTDTFEIYYNGSQYFVCAKPYDSLFKNPGAKKQYKPNFTYYRGVLCEIPTAKVNGGIINGKFFGDIEFETGEKIFFEDAQRYKASLNINKDQHTLIYSTKDIEKEYIDGFGCSVNEETQEAQVYNDINTHKHKSNNNRISFNKLHADSVNSLLYQFKEQHSNKKEQESSRIFCPYSAMMHKSFINQFNSEDSASLFVMNIIRSMDDIYGSELISNEKQVFRIFVNAIDIPTAHEDDRLQSVITTDRSVLSVFNSIAGSRGYPCMHALFTNVNWERTLGLATVGNSAGAGICRSSSGTILTTSQGQQTTASQLSTLLTIAHETGHLLGSIHDPASGCDQGCYSPDRSRDCSPGGTNGNYLMYPTSQTGFLVNHKKFSPCSKEVILQLAMLPVRQSCLVDGTALTCGDGIIDPGEDCDSGTIADKCCQNCQFTSIATCSPSNGLCCNPDTCQIYASSDNQICSDETECSNAQYCKGNSVNCDEPNPKPKGTLCNENTNKCNELGECSDSICSDYGMEQCECQNEDVCFVCCLTPVVEIPQLFMCEKLKKEIQYPPFTICNGGAGYCDADGTCSNVNIIPNPLNGTDSNLLTEIILFLVNDYEFLIIIAIYFILLIIAISIMLKRDIEQHYSIKLYELLKQHEKEIL